MNNLSRFDRNKILSNSEKTNILLPPSLYFQKNKTFIDITQEEDKSNLILNNKNNLNSYSTKNSKGINLMFDYKNNLNKKKKQNHYFNYTNDQSPNKTSKLNINNKKMNKIEENKNENIYNFKKVHPNKTAGRFTEINHVFNKPSSNIVAKYYSNNKILDKKKHNFSINFNLNSPISGYNTNKNNNGVRNKKLNIQFKSESKTNNNHKSYININETNNNYQNETDFDTYRFTLGNNQTRISESYDRNNPYFNNPLSSNTYLNTENNINSRNISKKKLNSIHNKNYNLMNIDCSTERNNTYSNLNSNRWLFEYDIKRQNKNKIQYKNIKCSFKTKDAYICKENKINKKSLKQFYEQEFNNENNQNLIKIEKNENKFNSEDLYYKECLSTNHSTCTNEINKVNGNEIRKRIMNQKQFMNKNSQNPEMFHFYMVSYLQKGKKLGNKFN